jgi:hypothetical protein
VCVCVGLVVFFSTNPLFTISHISPVTCFVLALKMQQYLLDLPTIDMHAKDDRGQSALDAARVNQKMDAVRLLEAYGAR